jgi:hypothetical protein
VENFPKLVMHKGMEQAARDDLARERVGFGVPGANRPPLLAHEWFRHHRRS